MDDCRKPCITTTHMTSHTSNLDNSSHIQNDQMDWKDQTQRIVRVQPKRAARCGNMKQNDKSVEHTSNTKNTTAKKTVSRQVSAALCKQSQANKNVLIEVGQLVLAKQKYSVPWPSRIIAVKKESVDVYFFGDGRSGPVKKCDLFSVSDSTEIIVNCIKRNILNYRKSVIEMEKVSGVPEHLSILNLLD